MAQTIVTEEQKTRAVFDSVMASVLGNPAFERLREMEKAKEDRLAAIEARLSALEEPKFL